TLQRQGVCREILRQKLQCHSPPKPRVFCFEYDTHASPADFAEYTVMRNGSTYHWSEYTESESTTFLLLVRLFLVTRKFGSQAGLEGRMHAADAWSSTAGCCCLPVATGSEPTDAVRTTCAPPTTGAPHTRMWATALSWLVL